jgi:hypothetical protein
MSVAKTTKLERKEERRRRYKDGDTREVWTEEDRIKFKSNCDKMRPYWQRFRDEEETEREKREQEDKEKRHRSRWELPLVGD